MLGSIVTGSWSTAAVVCVVALVATAGVACYIALGTAGIASVFGIWFAAYTTLNPRDDVEATPGVFMPTTPKQQSATFAAS